MLKFTSIRKRKVFIALLLVLGTHLSMGSFTGAVDDNSKAKYSLKNFNKNFYKKSSPFSLTAGFQYKGTQLVNIKKTLTGTTYNTMMRFEKGNTTYIYPYKHKVNVPLFKAPTAPSVQ